MEQLRDQHVVVTGASGELGRAVCGALLACGARVSAVARRRTALDALRAELRHHDRLHVAEGDAADGPSVEKLFDALERGTGPVDAVVHTVGAFAMGAFDATEDATFELLYRQVYLTSALVARASLRRMAPRGRGRLVLTGATASETPSPGLAAYGAMKAAVAHLARSLAAEYRPAGVMVNAVLPGTMDTEANRRAMGAGAAMVSTARVAGAITMLLGEGAASVSGAVLPVTAAG